MQSIDKVNITKPEHGKGGVSHEYKKKISSIKSSATIYPECTTLKNKINTIKMPFGLSKNLNTCLKTDKSAKTLKKNLLMNKDKTKALCDIKNGFLGKVMKNKGATFCKFEI